MTDKPKILDGSKPDDLREAVRLLRRGEPMSDKPKWMPGQWQKATDYLERDRKAHIAAHGAWHLDPGKLEAAFEGTPQAVAADLYAALEAAPEPPDVEGLPEDKADLLQVEYWNDMRVWWADVRAAALAKARL